MPDRVPTYLICYCLALNRPMKCGGCAPEDDWLAVGVSRGVLLKTIRDIAGGLMWPPPNPYVKSGTLH